MTNAASLPFRRTAWSDGSIGIGPALTHAPPRAPVAAEIESRTVAAEPTPLLRLTLLGTMRAIDANGANVLPRQRKTRAILAVLAMAASRQVLRAELIRLLWSRRDIEQGRQSLRQAIHELSECLAPVGAILRVDRGTLALRSEAIWSDAAEAGRATAYQPDKLDALSAGPFLQDLEGLDPELDAFIGVERTRMVRAAAQVAEAALEVCRGEDVAGPRTIAAAERLVALDPLAEGGWRALMQAHAARDERGAALSAFERCSAALQRIAGAVPSPATIALLAACRGEGAPYVTQAVPATRETADEASSAVGSEASSESGMSAFSGLRAGVRLGVMPFRTLETDPWDGLAFGLAEEITTALARFRWIYLIASPSLAAVQAHSPQARERLLSRLALDFLLDGTIQRAAGRVRVMVRLLDMRAPSGSGPELVWTQRYDGTDADLLTLQERLAAETVAQVDPQLLLHEARRVTLHPPRDATAYHRLLRAIPAIHRLDEATFRGAGEQLAQAVVADPNYAAAHAWHAYWSVFLVGQGWAADPAAVMLEAGQLAERAVQLDPSDARALTIAGHVRAFLQQRPDEAMALHDRALRHNPNLPLAWVLSGLALAYEGQHAEATRRAEEARRLSPFDPHHFFFDACEMVPQLACGRFEHVVELARRSIAHNAGLSSTYKGYLAALGHLPATPERLAECASVRARLLALEPGFSVAAALARSPLRRLADRALYADGLRAAGLPDGP